MSLEAKGRKKVLVAAGVMHIFIALKSFLHILERSERAKKVNKKISRWRKVMIHDGSCIVGSGFL